MRIKATLIFLGIAVAFCFAGPLLASRATWISDIANSAVPFATMPFALGILAGPRLWRGLLIGLIACVLMIGVFYWADDLSSEYPFNSSGFTTYLAQALIIGPLCGVLGAGVSRLSRAWRLMGALLFGAISVCYQVMGMLAPDNRTFFDNVTLLGSGLIWAALILIAALVAPSSLPTAPTSSQPAGELH